MQQKYQWYLFIACIQYRVHVYRVHAQPLSSRGQREPQLEPNTKFVREWRRGEHPTLLLLNMLDKHRGVATRRSLALTDSLITLARFTMLHSMIQSAREPLGMILRSFEGNS